MPDSPGRDEQGLDIRYDIEYSGTEVHFDGIRTAAWDRVAKPYLVSWPALKDIGKEKTGIENRIYYDRSHCVPVSVHSSPLLARCVLTYNPIYSVTGAAGEYRLELEQY